MDKQEAVLREQEITASLRKEIEDLKLVQNSPISHSFIAFLFQAINTEAAEKEGLQAKLEETNGKLVNAELSKSQAISETDSFKALLQQQFTDQLAQYRVKTRVNKVIQDCFHQYISPGASTAVCSDHCCYGGETA